MAPVRKLKTYKRTWNGVPGVLTEYHLDGSSLGLRITVLELDDGNGRASVEVVKGDGRLPTFQRLFSQDVAKVELPALITSLLQTHAKA
jgi:hypothetical protein